ncbi:MAG: right-handed parallel beta-helix repeat-containing protein [Candidatus Delongbacteria bacterium]|nr:right-handed parallel beta-helix repeat-containing protein [Candidatus Delongbacteria bacterium]
MSRSLCQISLVLASFCGTLNAAILTVPGDHSTIQQALNAANDLDTVRVSAGIWPENLVLANKNLVLESVSGPELTIVDGMAAGSVLRIHGSLITEACVIQGFTFTGGTGTALSVSGIPRGGVGGGIFCHDGADPVIRGNVLVENVASAPQGLGGGIFVWSCAPRIQDNRIQANSSHYGGGLFLMNSTSDVVGNLITGNTTQPSGKGGGIRILYGAPLIQNNTLVGNFAHWIGSAIAASEPGCHPTLNANLIVGNLNSNPLDFAYSAWVETSCNEMWNNQTGDIWPSSQYMHDLGGNIIADPRFCPDAYTLYSTSPALPGQHPTGADCGLIGAFGPGCGAVADVADLPGNFDLLAPAPNPFNPSTRCTIVMRQTAPARLELFDLQGRRVMTLLDGLLSRGEHSVQLEGQTLASGVYLLVLSADQERRVQKVTLLK